MVSFLNAGRLGNWAYQCAATMGYAWRHGLEFTVPEKPPLGKPEQWNPVYGLHLVNPNWNPRLPTITIHEKGYPYQELPWNEQWRDKNIVLNGYFQSELYFKEHRERVFDAFGFPWGSMPGLCAVHVRLGDARRYPEKHYLLEPEWYSSQMEKFQWRRQFVFFSDEIEWAKEHFGHRLDCMFAPPFAVPVLPDNRPEVRDLVAGSWCSDIIGSSSTFAIWQYLLNRNPQKRGIFPKKWLVENWQGTTAETWRDVLPPEVERA